MRRKATVRLQQETHDYVRGLAYASGRSVAEQIEYMVEFADMINTIAAQEAVIAIQRAVIESYDANSLPIG